MQRLRLLCGTLSILALMVSGCASPETRAGRDLADTVKIEGFRRLSEVHKVETTLLYFVGPPVPDLAKMVSARGWSPKPPPSGLPEVSAFKWVADGTFDTGEYRCSVVVSTLRPGYEDVAIDLNQQEKKDVAEGRLVYVEVACFCAYIP